MINPQTQFEVSMFTQQRKYERQSKVKELGGLSPKITGDITI